MKAMKDKRKSRLFLLLFLAGMAACLVPIIHSCCLTLQHEAQRDQLKDMVERSAEMRNPDAADTTDASDHQDENSPAGFPAEDDTAEGFPGEEMPSVLDKYAALYEANGDFTGWLSIEGTEIDYPVMQNEDDDYYLHHDFYGEESKYGCLYVRRQADLDAGTNFIIYGHNMKDGSMFGDLDLYVNESFCKEHPAISFDTLYEERTYEIIAVFRSQVYREGDDVFKYYQFYEADTIEEFAYFYDNIKDLSLYDTGVEAEFGDTFLTLSTCAYHVEDGRFVIVAKRIQ